jgi:hypothetical protein
VTERVIGGAVCVRVREVRARVPVRVLSELGVANFTNSCAVVGWRVGGPEWVVGLLLKVSDSPRSSAS